MQTGEQVDAVAKYIAKTLMRYKWEDLPKVGRAADAGYLPWRSGGHANARQDDYRDAAREIIGILNGMEE